MKNSAVKILVTIQNFQELSQFSIKLKLKNEPKIFFKKIRNKLKPFIENFFKFFILHYIKEIFHLLLIDSLPVI